MMLATLVVLLLVLHHPLMGVMPASAEPYHASATLLGTLGHGSVSTVSASGAGRTFCPACAMPCPLTQGVPPDRLTLGSPASPTQGAVPAALSPTLFLQRCSAGAQSAAATGHTPSTDTRRAVFQVFLV